MNFLEKDLENIIYELPGDKIKNLGLEVHGIRFRQLRIGNYGIADLVYVGKYFWDKQHPTVYVCELKKNRIDYDALNQAIGYVKGLQEYFKFKNYKYLSKANFQIILIGRDFYKGNFCFIPEVFKNVSIYTYKYNYDGIKFIKQYGYRLTNEGFK